MRAHVVLRHRRAAAIGITALAAIATFGPIAPAHAAISTCGSYSGRFAGYSATSVATIEGVYGKITTHTPALCTTNGSSSNLASASIMLADTGGVSARSAQVGYWRQTPTGTLRYFSQYSKGDGSAYVTTISGSPGVGTTNAYTVKWISSCTCLAMYANSAQLDVTPFNPFTSWSYPFDAHFTGSAPYNENDMPGTAGAKTKFSQIQVQDSGTDAFRATNIGTYSASTPGNGLGRWSKSAFGQDGTYGNNFDIWTP